MASSKKTGEYQGKPSSPDSVKKKLVFQGIPIHIDRPVGFKMRGEDEKGRPWERIYKLDYGFIPKTKGGDGDGVDVFLGPDAAADEAYWVAMTKPNGDFDEYKVFLGFPNRHAAVSAFVEHIPQKLMASTVTLKIDMMKAMLGLEPAPNFGRKLAFAAELSSLDDMLRDLSLRVLQARS